jgi:hypothetical protein
MSDHAACNDNDCLDFVEVYFWYGTCRSRPPYQMRKEVYTLPVKLSIITSSGQLELNSGG